MKPSAISIAAALLLAGCQFEVPLVKEDVIPVDPAIIGLWEAVPGEGQEKDGDARLLVLKFSETEYLIHTGLEKDGVRYRAYPIELGGVRCMQMAIIGDGDGPFDWGDSTPKPFLIASFAMKDGKLVVRMLDEQLFPDGLKTTEALQAAFLKNKDNPDLFGEQGQYRKVEGE